MSPKYRSAFIPIRWVWGGFGGNVDIFVGGREEVGAGAAGRCGVGVWNLVGGHVVALIG